MASLRVLTWLWRQENGRTSFSALHVNVWAAMLRRHCTLDIDIACVTDMPDGIDPAIRIIKPPGEFEGLQTSRWKGGRPSCYRRLAMFRRDAADIFGERFVSMDLDLVIGGNIDAILSRTEDFVICTSSQHGPRWAYNGSMMMLTAGARPEVYEKFTAEGAEEASRRYVGSDQAWLAHVLGKKEAKWTPDHGVVRFGQAAEGRMMFFPGHVKPWDVLEREWIGQHYRLDGGRSALVLGQKRTVWDDATRAMDGQKFDGVIALPAAAERWPGAVDAVAENRKHALQLARMLGFDRTALCGV